MSAPDARPMLGRRPNVPIVPASRVFRPLRTPPVTGGINWAAIQPPDPKPVRTVEDVIAEFRAEAEKGREDELRARVGVVRDIIRATATACKVSYAEVMSESRPLAVIAARQRAMADIALTCAWLSLAGIGRVFGKDHTTVINALRNEAKRRGHAIRGLEWKEKPRKKGKRR